MVQRLSSELPFRAPAVSGMDVSSHARARPRTVPTLACAGTSASLRRTLRSCRTRPIEQRSPAYALAARACLLAALALSLVACGGDGIAQVSTESCRDYCEKLEICDNRTDLDGCARMCSEQRVRSDIYLGARATCIVQGSCNQWLDKIGTMGEEKCDADDCYLNDCTDDALSGQKADAARVYCTRNISKLRACDMTIDVAALDARCLRLYPTLSDVYLSEIQACVETECSNVRPCLDDLEDRRNTELTIYPKQASTPAPVETPTMHDAGVTHVDAGLVI